MKCKKEIKYEEQDEFADFEYAFEEEDGIDEGEYGFLAGYFGKT